MTRRNNRRRVLCNRGYFRVCGERKREKERERERERAKEREEEREKERERERERVKGEGEKVFTRDDTQVNRR